MSDKITFKFKGKTKTMAVTDAVEYLESLLDALEEWKAKRRKELGQRLNVEYVGPNHEIPIPITPCFFDLSVYHASNMSVFVADYFTTTFTKVPAKGSE